MIFNSIIDTPANTTKNDPLRTDLKCVEGLIYQVEFYFPPGSSGLLGIQIRNQNVSLYPRNRESWFIGDNLRISFPDLYELRLTNNILEIFTYNTDTDYDHQIQVSIGIVAHEEFISHFLPGRSVRDLIETMNALSDIISVSSIPTNKSFIDRILKKDKSNG